MKTYELNLVDFTVMRVEELEPKLIRVTRLEYTSGEGGGEFIYPSFGENEIGLSVVEYQKFLRGIGRLLE